MNKELISVVIVNYNRCNDLRNALKSVLTQKVNDLDVIVVDNASTDNSILMLRSEYPEVRYKKLNENIGMDGYSIGFEMAKGEYIFQMDNDSLMPDENVLSEVVRRFSEGPSDLAVVATRVEEYREGDSIESHRSKNHDIGPINTGGFHSGGVGFKRNMLDKAGYYNRDVFLYGSEAFLQMKILAAGYKIYYYPEILMLHKSSGVARSALSTFYKVRNRYWFMRTYLTKPQQKKLMPSLIVHDLLYGIYTFSLKSVLKGIRNGMGPLPPSLSDCIFSNNQKFQQKVRDFISYFGWCGILQRLGRLNGKLNMH
ncbi:MAG: glycosyltransferase [Smithella sp.]|nr:glycosyltransferase [Smithella sp.]